LNKIIRENYLVLFDCLLLDYCGVMYTVCIVV